MLSKDRIRSHHSRIKSAVCALFIVALALPTSAQDNLPDLGDYSGSILSNAEEAKLGREFMREIRRQLDFIDDTELVTYINILGRHLADYSDQPGRKYTFYLVRDNTLNAFAVPGGYITVHTGLITTTRHESELASVLAHEIAHITQSHMARMVARSKRNNIPAMAALIAAILLGGPIGEAALVGTQATILDKQLQYSRGFEEEADAIGIRTLAGAGYDPRAMPEFFGRLQQYSRSLESSAPEFLRTHPLTYSRIAESESRAENYPRVENPDETQFLLMQAKIRALYEGTNLAKVEAGFASRLAENNFGNFAAERYGHALAMMANGKYTEARSKMTALLQEDPKRVSYMIALAQIEMSAGRRSSAVSVYEAARKIYPNNLVLDLYFIDALIANDQYAEAKKVLKSHLLVRRRDPRLYRLLARAEGEAGNSLQAHQALAEFYYYNGNPREALRQLSLAEKYTGESFYAQSSVEARTEEIQRELLNSGQKLP